MKGACRVKQSGRCIKLAQVAALFLVLFSGQRCEKEKQGVSPARPSQLKQAVQVSEGAGLESWVDAEKKGEVATSNNVATLPEELLPALTEDEEAQLSSAILDASLTPDSGVAPLDAQQKPAPPVEFKNVPKIPSFKPALEQPVADPKELEYLTNHAKTRKILAEGGWAKRDGMLTLKPMRRERIKEGLAWRFQILLALSEEEDPIVGLFKPRQSNYHDWLKEIHAYTIGNLIGAPTIPTVLRFFTKKSFSRWLNKTPEEETSMFEWEGRKEPRIRGALKYWIPSYFHRRLGDKIADEHYLNKIAASLHPANLQELKEKYPLYLEVGRGIIFDYLILNEDRPENLGTLLLPDGSYKLILIDNGLALGVQHGGRTVMKKMFKKMRIFPKDMIDKMRLLNKEQLTGILRPHDDPVMWLPEVRVEQLLERRDDIVQTADKWHRKWGDIVWY